MAMIAVGLLIAAIGAVCPQHRAESKTPDAPAKKTTMIDCDECKGGGRIVIGPPLGTADGPQFGKCPKCDGECQFPFDGPVIRLQITIQTEGDANDYGKVLSYKRLSRGFVPAHEPTGKVWDWFRREDSHRHHWTKEAEGPGTLTIVRPVIE